MHGAAYLVLAMQHKRGKNVDYFHTNDWRIFNEPQRHIILTTLLGPGRSTYLPGLVLGEVNRFERAAAELWTIETVKFDLTWWLISSAVVTIVYICSEERDIDQNKIISKKKKNQQRYLSIQLLPNLPKNMV